MDFTFSDEQTALRELAAQIFEGSSDVDRVTEMELTDDRFDAALWQDLATANLLGVAVPEEHGGLGFGMLELVQVLEQQGRAVAVVPLLPTLVLGALPIARFGTPDHCARWLPAIVEGRAVFTAALADYGVSDPLLTSVAAQEADGGWVLSGAKPAVPAAHLAQRILVPARTAEGSLGVFLVDPEADGVRLVRNDATDREIHCTMHLDDVRVPTADVLGDPTGGAAIVEWIVERANVAIAATVVGCCEAATRLTAEYTSQREQFGRPLSTNQGVALRAADCYIDTDNIRLVMLKAAWLLDEGLPASDAVAAAKWWSAEAGQRVVHATQHLHGGMGADIDYPVHRYFLWVKQLENTLGGASAQLARLGSALADRARVAAGPLA
ncbi:MAG: acyl-CoA/acyl-ACP dehydrogenase [Acidimicrobiales bacterium]|nr:acyl-CoA/acyl-ACP dehydrogenase [Acidimicrobiales bacterium]